jgi:hypothetical protein
VANPSAYDLLELKWLADKAAKAAGTNQPRRRFKMSNVYVPPPGAKGNSSDLPASFLNPSMNTRRLPPR